MKATLKLVPVIALFSILFFTLRFFGRYVGYNVSVLVSDLGGLTYLYSTVGTIFAIFAGFVVVSESQDWNTLSAGSKNEVRELNELFVWSRRLSKPLAERFSMNIQKYLTVVIQKEWKSLEQGTESPEAEALVNEFHGLLAEASKENPDIAYHMFTSFDEFMNNRATRIMYSWQPLPAILKFTVILVDVAVMGLSLFIGVKDMWLDYLFMVCIVTLGSVILMVVDDLDNPLRPGDWYLSSGEHQRLLRRIQPP